MVFLLIPFTIFVIFIFIGFALFAKKQEQGGEDKLKQIYIYLVLFATLMMTIGGGVSVFMALSDMISPSAYYQSFDDYKSNQKMGVDKTDANAQPTDEQIKKSYDVMIADQTEQTKRNAKNALIKSLGFIVIPFPIFLLYSRKLKTLK
jgi:hypothetical protein